jgi:hypothetical protein
MADVWEPLADEQSQGSDLSTRPAPTAAPRQPTVQQQQQIQPDEDKKKRNSRASVREEWPDLRNCQWRKPAWREPMQHALNVH